MELGGRFGKVMACLEHPGRFYGRGKTELHTSLQGKIEKSGRGGGLVWGQKVVRHMPWGALSGSPRVRGQERVFWGLSVWWFPCPSGPILAIHADTDQI